jgi:hypothetical protein
VAVSGQERRPYSKLRIRGVSVFGGFLGSLLELLVILDLGRFLHVMNGARAEL